MSDKSVAERLQVKRGRRLAVVGASADLDRAVGALQARAKVAEADVVLLVALNLARLQAQLRTMLGSVPQAAILWVAYPKRTSHLAADLSRDVVRSLAREYGLDTVSQIAIDDGWSALRLKRAG